MTRLYVVNPLSARVARKGSVLSRLAHQDNTPAIVLDPFDVLPEAVEAAARAGVTHVLIEGGDGTVQGVVSEFLKQAERFTTFPMMSIVPGGMTNQVARNIGFRKATDRHIATRLDGTLEAVSVPLLNVSATDGSRHCGFLLSTGAVPQMTRYTTSELHEKGIGGSLAVLGGVLKGLRGDDDTLMQSTPIAIDSLFQGDHLGTIVTTLPGLLLGLDPFWGDENAPLRLTWVEADYRNLARNILGIWAGRKALDRRADGFHSTNRDALDYSYVGPTVLDGEFLSFPSGKFTVRPTEPVTFLR